MTDTLLPDKPFDLTAEKGPLKPCRFCEATTGKLVSGTTIHAAGIRCGGCNRHIAWVGKELFKKLTGDAA